MRGRNKIPRGCPARTLSGAVKRRSVPNSTVGFPACGSHRPGPPRALKTAEPIPLVTVRLPLPRGHPAGSRRPRQPPTRLSPVTHPVSAASRPLWACSAADRNASAACGSGAPRSASRSRWATEPSDCQWQGRGERSACSPHLAPMAAPSGGTVQRRFGAKSARREAPRLLPARGQIFRLPAHDTDDHALSSQEELYTKSRICLPGAAQGQPERVCAPADQWPLRAGGARARRGATDPAGLAPRGPEKGDSVPAREGPLSRATVDQIFFAARLALAEIVCGPERRPFLVIDDAFCTY